MVASAYASKLNDLFDRVYVHGVAEVARADLLLWHDGQQRVTKKLWHNINEAWTRRCETQWGFANDELPLLLRAYNGETGMYYLAWGGEPDPETGKIIPWFNPLTEVDEEEENFGDEEDE